MIRLAALLVFALGLLACSEATGDRVSTSRVPASEARGRGLVMELECVRCHSRAERKTDRDCVVCHNAIARGAETGRYDLIPIDGAGIEDRVRMWNRNIVHFRELPSFVGMTRLLRSDWIESYLMHPHDLRPRLGESMPHLGIDRQAARDIVAYVQSLDAVTGPGRSYFEDEAIADYQTDTVWVAAGDIVRGRTEYDRRGCASCHAFTGVFDARGALRDDERETRALELAPDLRHTRARFQPLRLVPWLLDPSFYKHDAAMPKPMDLSYQQARDLAAFIMGASIDAASLPSPVKRPTHLPLLDRDVFYDEVYAEVFGRICIHCHSDPDAEIGDGGPGFAGGFGFPERKLDLSDYESTFAGYIDDAGKRRSIFEPMADGTPRLVAALLARWDEQASGEPGEVRGMPLSLPPLSAHQIQLVQTWIDQGRRR